MKKFGYRKCGKHYYYKEKVVDLRNILKKLKNLKINDKM